MSKTFHHGKRATPDKVARLAEREIEREIAHAEKLVYLSPAAQYPLPSEPVRSHDGIRRGYANWGKR